MTNIIDVVKLLGKKVKIIDTDNIEYIGYFLDYTTASNNEENEWSIDVFPTKSSNIGIELFQSDIKSIQPV